MKHLTVIITILASVLIADSYPYYPVCKSNDASSYVLNTLNGKVKGNCYNVPVNYANKPKSARPIVSFLGIPYAQPPVGKLRFKNALPVNSWSHRLDGTKLPNRCYQGGNSGIYASLLVESEDCLQLNVFVPHDIYLNGVVLKNNSFKAPIYVYIHGGAFLMGASLEETHEPSTFVAASNVIVVNINYRLGVFGYLYANGTDARGNQGILDQHLALKWVFENAHTFGGDNTRITIGGESAGALAVGLHLVYKPSWPYFNNAIVQSGTLPYTKLITPAEATRRLNGVTTNSNCSKSTGEQTLDCLRTIEPSLLVKLSSSHFNLNSWPIIVLDGVTFRKQPSESIALGETKNASLLIGSNTKEMALSFAPNGFTPLAIDNAATLAGILMFSFANNQSLVKNIIDLYLSSTPPQTVDNNSTLNYVDTLIEATSDSNFVVPSIQLADHQSKLNPDVFVYSYAYHISSSPFASKYEAVHAEELFMVFGEPLSAKSKPTLNSGFFARYSSASHVYTHNERVISEAVVNYWSSFIRTGCPSPEWPRFSSGNRLDRLIMKLNGTTAIGTIHLSDAKYLLWKN